MSDEDEIEVGAEGDNIRLWSAKEAVRQGELKLKAQEANLLAGEGRATSLLTWSLGILTAVFVAMITHASTRVFAVGIGVAIPLAFAQVFCVRALWPRFWSSAGYNPEIILELGLRGVSELEILEKISLDYEVAIQENQTAYRNFCEQMKIAWTLFCTFPPVGAFGLAFYFFFVGTGG